MRLHRASEYCHTRLQRIDARKLQHQPSRRTPGHWLSSPLVVTAADVAADSPLRESHPRLAGLEREAEVIPRRPAWVSCLTCSRARARQVDRLGAPRARG